MATIYDVARQAGVSIGTVSRFLNQNGYVSEAARERIQAAVEALGFAPSGVARGLSSKQTRMIGVVVPDLVNLFIPEVVRGIQDVMDNAGYCAVIYNTDGLGAREARALKLLYERRVDGMILLPPSSEEGNAQIEELHRQGLPQVLLGRDLPGLPLDSVTVDTYRGAVEAMQHLLALGHTRIAFVSDRRLKRLSGRLSGYRDALEQAGLPLDDELLFEMSSMYKGTVLDRMLQVQDPPTAVFSMNDMIAIDVIQEAYQRGIKVPDHLSIIGFDDITFAASVQPPLTTIAQPKSLLGQTAAELLLARIEQKASLPVQEVLLSCQLIVRMSTARR
ncbi:LacI family DNA-binding transcriptional regulator [Tengunoibacter tsumagoiensis]|uniref:LacI family transcriptional regulator n=1 Tax=Tengunoibacter tsumagoiensis TaxID=2014871 RepID=A0A402A4D9_9CHLR|nr:LacI family DNA-binding transcriptional regulator [Tengunoibacter tsumagoiensis]GCE14017.1 LacI family transcriptional regulator [Tengunoibacter tsumagoiensis]